MKKHSVKIFALLFVLALFAAACSLKAQTVAVSPAASLQGAVKPANAIVDANGNYQAVTHKKVASEQSNTGKTFTDTKGTVYPVFKSSAGKLYYIRTSKTSGNDYKVYLTL